MNNSVIITIRNVETSDISIFFEQQLDLEANRMAAFVRGDPHDRAAFDTHWKRIMDSTGIVKKTILRGEEGECHVPRMKETPLPSFPRLLRAESSCLDERHNLTI
jgi:hypothetical protein